MAEYTCIKCGTPVGLTMDETDLVRHGGFVYKTCSICKIVNSIYEGELNETDNKEPVVPEKETITETS